MPVEIPAVFLAYAARCDSWRQWIDALPRLVRDISAEWELTVDGHARHGYAALVVPVRDRDGRRCVVKFSGAHEEQEHEHLGLQRWQGYGAVRMYRADPARGVMLLERLHDDRDLTGVDDVEACVITAGFYRRLHVPALPQLRRLSSYIATWTDDLGRLPVRARIPRRLVEQAYLLGRSFVADATTDGTLIHGDLHYENVLAADREPWLVIDPKPMSGDAHYEVAPLLWNRWDEVVASGDVRSALRRRFHAVVDTAGLDEDRARDWVVVRMTHNALWCLQDGPDSLYDEDQDYLTMCITVAKAVQD